MKKIVLFCILSTFLAFPAEAAIDDNQAIKALIGEAGGQQDDELLAHAYALKNRGTLKGVYGLYATHTPKPTEEQWQKVSRAWWIARLDEYDPMEGRTEWRSEYDLKLMAEKGRTLESQGLYDGLKVGQTTFYRLKK